MAQPQANLPTLADIASEAANIASEIQGKGVDIANKAEIVASVTKLLGVLDKVQPHINQAQQAFGGQEATIAQANDLRNTLNRIKATYSA